MSKAKLAAVVILVGLGGIVRPAAAQVGANLEGLTVAGKGVAMARPNRMEIELEISAASEMSADVIVKYREARKRLQEAFANLKMSNVSIEEKALAVDQKGQTFNPYMGEMSSPKRGKVEVQLTRKLVVRCNEIREMDEEAILQLVARLLDVAQDAGAKVGPQQNPMLNYYWSMMADNGLVKFILDDFEGAEDKAYAEAVADARARATRLAKLNGVELGPVLGAREAVVPGEKVVDGQPMYYNRLATGFEEEPRKRQIESTKFREIPVKVELQVRFATVAGKGAAK